MSMRLAVRLPDLGAAVAFYGQHPEAQEAGDIRVPLMLHHASLDERVNASWPNFRQGLESAKRDFIEYQYADTKHGFHNHTTPRYDENAAELAWQRTVESFKERLEIKT